MRCCRAAIPSGAAEGLACAHSSSVIGNQETTECFRVNDPAAPWGGSEMTSWWAMCRCRRVKEREGAFSGAGSMGLYGCAKNPRQTVHRAAEAGWQKRRST